MATEASRPKRILVAPLDWGLGHATRCIPLIRELLQLGVEVVIGAGGAAAELLAGEFPSLERLSLPGYGIRYTGSGSAFGLKMLTQLPRIRQAIHREQKVLHRWLATHAVDAIVSDNRFGLCAPGIPSVLMTHQLAIRSPFGPLSERWLQWANYHYINRFDACWVVDFPGAGNLAGRLSHPENLPSVPVTYLGCLSRFEPGQGVQRYDLTVVLSGPEPQRTLFEQLVLPQLQTTNLRVLVVRGIPGAAPVAGTRGGLETAPHLDTAALNEALLASGLVLCRAGYSSVMDLVRLGKRAVLVPTPGQTEQEYLADYLSAGGYFPSLPQRGFRLEEALSSAARFAFRKPDLADMDAYRGVLKTFVENLRTGPADTPPTR